MAVPRGHSDPAASLRAPWLCASSSWTSMRSRSFDLLLTLLLKEELEPADVDMAAIVVAFVDRLAEREELDLEACGEFLVLIAALLELKARALFPDEEAELADLEPEEAAEELARRLAEYRRMKEAAAWLAEQLAANATATSGSARRRSRPGRSEGSQRRIRSSWPATLRLLAAPPPEVSLSHMSLISPPVSQFLERFRAILRRRGCPTSTPRSARSRASTRRSRSWRCSSCARRADRTRPGRRSTRSGFPVPTSKEVPNGSSAPPDHPNPVDQLARTVEALLVVASAPLSVDELADAAADDAERIELRAPAAGGALPRGRSGIVLEHVARRLRLPRRAGAAEGVWAAVRAAGRARALAGCARDALDRRLPRPGRPEIARIRGVAADSTVAGLLERGLIAEAGREDGAGGAVRYRTTPLFERVFGLERRRAAAPRRPRRERRGDPRAAPLRGRRQDGVAARSCQVTVCYEATQRSDAAAN